VDNLQPEMGQKYAFLFHVIIERPLQRLKKWIDFFDRSRQFNLGFL